MDLAQKIATVASQLFSTSDGVISTLVSVFVFAVLYYYMIKFLSDNNSGFLVMLFIFVMVVSAAILTFYDKLNSAIYLIIPSIFVIAMLVLYSVEIKRLLWTHRKLKNTDVKNSDGVSYDEEKVQKCIAEIINKSSIF